MKLHDPTKPYVIEVLYTFQFQPTDGVVWHAWESLVEQICTMTSRKRYRGVDAVLTEGGPTHFPYFTFTAGDRQTLERFLDRAFVLARHKHVRILR